MEFLHEVSCITNQHTFFCFKRVGFAAEANTFVEQLGVRLPILIQCHTLLCFREGEELSQPGQGPLEQAKTLFYGCARPNRYLSQEIQRMVLRPITHS